MTHAAPGPRYGRRGTRIIAGVAAAVLLWILAGLALFVYPKTAEPAPADVLFVLGPPTARVEYAEKLMNEGIAPTIAISMPVDENGEIQGAYCDAARPYKIICFHPDPFTTEGEALALTALAEEHGWQTANVVAPTFHVFRAEWIIERCFPGTVSMVEYKEELTPLEWVYLFVYQSAASVKAAVNTRC